MEVPDTFRRWIGNDDEEAGKRILLDAIAKYEAENVDRERQRADHERKRRRQAQPRGLRRLFTRRGGGS